MMSYMSCDVYLEHRGRGHRKSWVIRDSAWGNKLVRDLGPTLDSAVDTFEIIRKWNEDKKTNPEWIEFKNKKVA